ncbi:MAG: hypothetical protein IJT23_03175 [Clostridia bacterium]|nr:hypothetical protein [Clostridia bacterium]
MEKYIRASFEVVEFGEENILTESVAQPDPNFVKGNSLGYNGTTNWDNNNWGNYTNP